MLVNHSVFHCFVLEIVVVVVFLVQSSDNVRLFESFLLLLNRGVGASADKGDGLVA